MHPAPSIPSSAARYAKLYRIAAAQEGYFTTAQAAEAGYSPQLLAKHLKSGRLVRVRRRVYRIVQFPPGENEDLVVIWLWSDREGIFSHETALALHDLSDVPPSRAHLTFPECWRKPRLRLPPGVVLHYAGVTAAECAWIGAVPVTSARRNSLAESTVLSSEWMWHSPSRCSARQKKWTEVGFSTSPASNRLAFASIRWRRT